MSLINFLFGVGMLFIGIVIGVFKSKITKRYLGVLNLYYEEGLDKPSMYVELYGDIDTLKSSDEALFRVREIKEKK